jgi:hypothetical protein
MDGAGYAAQGAIREANLPSGALNYPLPLVRSPQMVCTLEEMAGVGKS